MISKNLRLIPKKVSFPLAIITILWWRAISKVFENSGIDIVQEILSNTTKVVHF